MDNNVCFTFDFEYDMKALADIVYNINNWDSYILLKWDETKYTIDNFTGVTYRYYKDHKIWNPPNNKRTIKFSI